MGGRRADMAGGSRDGYDPSKIHEIDYKGKYFSMKGVQQTHPSPQRTPIIFQAGASKAGIEFGGKHAEAIFCHHSTIADAKKYAAAGTLNRSSSFREQCYSLDERLKRRKQNSREPRSFAALKAVLHNLMALLMSI